MACNKVKGTAVGADVSRASPIDWPSEPPQYPSYKINVHYRPEKRIDGQMADQSAMRQ
jgi:hypothetical protein